VPWFTKLAAQLAYPESMHANPATHSDMIAMANAERRSAPRYAIADLDLEFRLKGRWRRSGAIVLDFNRFGLAMQTDTPQRLNQYLFLQLRHRELSVSGVVGVVHNCVQQADGYRCGIQFRPDLKFQSQAERVKKYLRELEARLAFTDAPPTETG